MRQKLQMFFLNPEGFFRDKAAEQNMRLLPLLLLLLIPVVDFASKTVLFYKIGLNSFGAQADWASLTGAFFGAATAQQITFGLKCSLYVALIYFIGRRLKSAAPLRQLVGMVGYCLTPVVLGSIALAAVYGFLLKPIALDLSKNAQMQLATALSATPVRLGEQLIVLNIWFWVVVLSVGMLKVYWRTRLPQTLGLLVGAFVAVEALDRVLGMALTSFAN